MEAFDSSLYSIAVTATVVLLFASTIYTLRNILKIWRKGAPSPVSSEKTINATHNLDRDESEGDENDKIIFEGGDAPEVDPMQYCEHIQSEVKKAKFRVAEKKIGETMTAEQIAEEKEMQRKQLEEIFRLMQEQNDKFGVNSVEDIQNQMKLYA
ncbi:matrix-remodeling-associated protein 7-like [Mytilus californianus]|uniref:matrix-remodeling-associated protein 7-like n=1 Tax=Mytilus californianus TaxID=6549 RepID=UPI0022457D94|nr:matrix-remodeling-associated protein 7-like [Mytilus californianus]XP_052071376.1 matrix-remodeling-associated protein 7-like [Mytilus californianus]